MADKQHFIMETTAEYIQYKEEVDERLALFAKKKNKSIDEVLKYANDPFGNWPEWMLEE